VLCKYLKQNSVIFELSDTGKFIDLCEEQQRKIIMINLVHPLEFSKVCAVAVLLVLTLYHRISK